MATLDKRYLIPGEKVLIYWDRWQENKGKRGYNLIPLAEMIELKSRNGVVVDYLKPILEKVI